MLELILYILIFLFIIFHVLTYSIRWYEEAKLRDEDHTIWEFSPRLILPILAEMLAHAAMTVLTAADFIVSFVRWSAGRLGILKRPGQSPHSDPPRPPEPSPQPEPAPQPESFQGAGTQPEAPSAGPGALDGRPVILLHGMGMRGLSLWPLAQRLRQAGKAVHAFTYWPPGRLIDGYARQLKEFIERLRREHGYRDFDVVAHSLGGLIVRRHMQMAEGNHHIRRFVTLGTPHRGSELWRFSIYAAGRQLRPGGEFLRMLDEGGLPQGVEAWAITSHFDELVIPNANGRWEAPGVTNISVENLGHARLVFNREVYTHVRKALT